MAGLDPAIHSVMLMDAWRLQMRLNGLVAVLSIPLLSGFVPILTYQAAIAAAQATCGKLIGKNIRADLYWFGSAPGRFDTNPATAHHWQLTARIQGDRSGAGHWLFKVDIPPSGAGPNTCVANGSIPKSELVAPVPIRQKPQPLGSKRET